MTRPILFAPTLAVCLLSACATRSAVIESPNGPPYAPLQMTADDLGTSQYAVEPVPPALRTRDVVQGAPAVRTRVEYFGTDRRVVTIYSADGESVATRIVYTRKK